MFLVSAAGVGATGAASVAVLGPRRVLHRLQLVNSPDHHAPASGWPVIEHSLTSDAMKRTITWAVAHPTTTPTGVLICLHGRNGNHREAFDSIHIHDVVADAGAALVVVSVDGGPDSYWHPRADGTDALSMVIDELLPAVDDELDAELPRAVLGWSMGGYGALLVAEIAPASFRAVVATSPALWRSYDEAASGAFDSEVDFQRFDVNTNMSALSSLTVRVDCGTDDGFIGAARRFARTLPHPNAGSFTPGFHDAGYWRSVAPTQVATILGAIER